MLYDASVPPRAFLSHSSLDKDRFAVGFAERLRAAGIDVWLDDWELRPGDSLMDRIFDQGLGQADVFVIVLSVNSIESPWVREELNNAAVRRIEGHCRVVPVVLDGIEVPEVLRDTVYQPVADCSSYDDEFGRIVDGILNRTAGPPPVGKLPTYALQNHLPGDNGLTPASRFMLAKMAELMAADPDRVFFRRGDLDLIREEGGISDQRVDVELSRLEHEGFVEIQRVFGPNLSCRLSPYGLLAGLETSGTDVASAWKRVAAFIANEVRDRSSQPNALGIAEATGQAPALVDALLKIWEGQSLLRVSRALGGLRTCRVVLADPLFEEQAY